MLQFFGLRIRITLLNERDYYMKIKFNNEQDFLDLITIGNEKNHIAVFGLSENLSGFIIYEDDEETVIQDCSNFVYRFNPYDDPSVYGVIYTDIPDHVKPPEDPDAKPIVIESEGVDQYELTQTVAELMMDVDKIKLGI